MTSKNLMMRVVQKLILLSLFVTSNFNRSNFHEQTDHSTDKNMYAAFEEYRKMYQQCTMRE